MMVQEVQAVRQSAGFRDVSARGRIQLKGKDSITWLHAICTQDIRALKAGQGAYSTCINDVGRLIFDFTVWVMADGLLMDVEGPVKDKALEWLDRYLITDDVVIEDVSNEYTALELAGPQSVGIL